MATMDSPDNRENRHYRDVIIEAGALLWIDDKENWKKWEKGLRWLKAPPFRRWFRARMFVTDLTGKKNGPVIGPGYTPKR